MAYCRKLSWNNRYIFLLLSKLTLLQVRLFLCRQGHYIGTEKRMAFHWYKGISLTKDDSLKVVMSAVRVLRRWFYSIQRLLFIISKFQTSQQVEKKKILKNVRRSCYYDRQVAPPFSKLECLLCRQVRWRFFDSSDCVIKWRCLICDLNICSRLRVFSVVDLKDHKRH